MFINYKDKEIKVRFSFRADMLFEDATGKTFKAINETEWLQYMFCTIVALTKDETLKFDDFIDWISSTPENSSKFFEFIDWYSDYQQSVMNLRKKTEPDLAESKKKVSRSKKK